MPRPEKVRLGEILLQQGLLTEQQLQDALDEQRRAGASSAACSSKRASSPRSRSPRRSPASCRFRSSISSTSPQARGRASACPRRRRAASARSCWRTAAPFYRVAMADPTDLFAYDEIARFLKRDIQLAVVTESVAAADHRPRLPPHRADQPASPRSSGRRSARRRRFRRARASAPRSRTRRSSGCCRRCSRMRSACAPPTSTSSRRRHGSSSASASTACCRCRPRPTRKIASALVLRLKLMSGLDISEKRLPQDGRFNVKVRNAQIDVRISTMPTQYGESVVMRLLQPEQRTAQARPTRHAARAFWSACARSMHRPAAWCW